MPRIYKPIGPSSNKAEAGPTANKTAPPTRAAKETESIKKKDESGDK